MLINRVIKFFLVPAFCCVSLQVLNAQIVPTTDVSTVKSEQFSDAQVMEYYKKAAESGMNLTEIEQLAIQKGMSPEDAAQLKNRVQKLQAQKKSTATTGQATDFSRGFADGSGASASKSPEVKPPGTRIFGQQLFNNPKLTFTPDINIPTPENYQLGPGDQLNIDISGYNEATYSPTVSPDGYVRLPYLGSVQVNGLSIAQARERIINKLAEIYGAINSGNTDVRITLGNIRSIQVTLIGEVTLPGTYTLPSLATAFNALYASGGPNNNGSFRNIEVIRDNVVIATIDVYDFLMYGDKSSNVTLRDHDVIKISPYSLRVEVRGNVKRPAIFEAEKGETFADLLEYAGGFTKDAYTGKVKVIRNADGQRSVAVVNADEYAGFAVNLGDVYTVDRILNRFTNRVLISGAVMRPGMFAITPDLTVKQLIEKASGLRADAFMNQANLYRVNADLSTEIISFSLSELMNGNMADIDLRREDSLHIASKFALREAYNVSISGQVQNPGTFSYSSDMNLEELVFMAGGFKEAATAKRVEVSRRVQDSDPTSENPVTAEILQFDISKNLDSASEAANFTLQPFDQVFIRTEPGYEVQKNVSVQGEVLYPGVYSTTNKKDRISDLLKRAGGLLPGAYPDGAVLIRKRNLGRMEKDLKAEQLETFSKLSANADSATLELKEEIVEERPSLVNIDLQRIMKKPGSEYDLLLENGDILRIPEKLYTVKVNGEVLYPKTIRFDKSNSFNDYISQAGGFSPRALKRRAYVVYANGAVKSTGKLLFFNNYPRIKPGAEIYVPIKPEKNNLNAQEVLGLSTGIASLAAIVLTLINISN